MGDRRKWNRRSFKFSGIDPKDGENTYKIISFKFNKKSFARPIVLEGKQAENWFMDQWKINGWDKIK